MPKMVTVCVTGHCPEKGGDNTINVSFGEIAFSGGSGKQYKKASYNCSYAEEHGCSAKGKNDISCPIYQNAYY